MPRDLQSPAQISHRGQPARWFSTVPIRRATVPIRQSWRRIRVLAGFVSCPSMPPFVSRQIAGASQERCDDDQRPAVRHAFLNCGTRRGQHRRRK